MVAALHYGSNKKSRDIGSRLPEMVCSGLFWPLPYAGVIRIRYSGFKVSLISALASSPSWY